MIEINLLPGSQGKSKRGAAFDPGALFGSIGEHFGDRYLLGAGAIVAASIAAIALMFVMQGRKEHIVAERQIAAARDSARFSAVLLDRTRAEARRDSVYQQLAIIKSIDDTRFVWPHILEEVNLAIPQYTWLTEVTQTSAVTTTAAGGDTSATARKADSAAKAGSGKENPVELLRRKRARADSLYRGIANSTKFRIVGQTVDIQALTLFMKNLEASPFIKNVQLTRSDLVTTDNKEVTQFQLEAETEPPPPSMIETVPLSVAVH
jgi:Tfp pilus assembly protein PilN